MISSSFDGVESSTLTHHAVFANFSSRFRSRDETGRAGLKMKGRSFYH